MEWMEMIEPLVKPALKRRKRSRFVRRFSSRLVPRRKKSVVPRPLFWAALIAAGALVTYAVTRRAIEQSRRRGDKPDTIAEKLAQPHRIRVEKTVTINKPVEEVYRFWRQLDNLPQFMNHLEQVRVIDNRHSHWVAKAPVGMKVQWDAEIVNDIENEFISWRSLDNADVTNVGSVVFRRLPDDDGTEVSVVLEYDPPAGVIGAAFAKLFGEEPSQQVDEDLNRLKQLLETGEVPPSNGHSGRLPIGDLPDFLKNVAKPFTEGEE